LSVALIIVGAKFSDGAFGIGTGAHFAVIR
jgi:hypothetical protein